MKTELLPYMRLKLKFEKTNRYLFGGLKNTQEYENIFHSRIKRNTILVNYA